MNALNRPEYRPKIELSFLELATKWETTIMAQHKPSSRNSEQAHLRHFKAYFGNAPVSRIRNQSLQQWMAGSKLKPRSIRNFLATVKLVFKAGIAWGYLKENPCNGVILPR